MTAPAATGRVVKTLALLLRAERMMAARRVSVLSKQAGFLIGAAIFGLVAVVMLNASAYLWLSTFWTPAWSAAAVGGANLLLMGLFLAIASGLSRRAAHSDEAKLRDQAQMQLEIELDILVEDLRGTANDLRALARDPLGTILPGVLMPLLNALLERAVAAATAAAHKARPADTPEPTPDFPEDPAAPDA